MSYYKYKFTKKTELLKSFLSLEQTGERVTQKSYSNLYNFSYVTMRSRTSCFL